MSSRVCNNCGIQVSENAKFCAGCGSILQHETSQPIPQNLNVIKNAKKGFSIGATIGILLGVVFLCILIAGAINGPSNTSTSSYKTTEQQAVNFVQNYKGTNGNGLSIVQIVSYIVNSEYPGEDITSNPSSRIGWTGLVHYDPNSSNVWQVEFDLKTYKENVVVYWLVNMDTHTIYPADATAKTILDLTNLPSNSVSNSTLSDVHLT